MTPFRSVQTLNGKIATLSQNIFRIQANCIAEVTEKENVVFIAPETSELKHLKS